MNSISRFGRRTAERATGWSCFGCRAAQGQWAGNTVSRGARFISKTVTKDQQHANPRARPELQGMLKVREIYKQRNRSTMFYTLSIILGTVAFSYGSVPLYKMLCQTIGWGGQPIKAHGSSGSGSDADFDLASRLKPVTDAKRIRVTFSSSVSDTLPWKFVPQQREVRVLPGETALAFYTATNKSDSDIIGIATYSVTPGQVAPYFSKIQCFCFEEQRLNAGETVDMPVFFYLDPDLLNDVNMKGVETVTLNYTFFSTFPPSICLGFATGY
ncbi:cytochrome c oxidase assembly protein CtaG/Cox11-domain-containing protein [Lasiosphaeria miniovina]|uniref:Cytochrome c oxidase assembly protein CtaG/Cox11-domain-containing protein n=1 Tax=Lasiosphaeria miniovina TaxID=1954250 RepID=A0AA39ZZV9_9PEZI|nr:cytochrome c oxidase assembly protein CtaG/Cox11-domain-containing protein [Lasiosphaeria miniovina]KAK0706711.1 cytochrome c oxidase assembly protein CtaG/Cox11-domain-containing protein [Lasiosphaeria miniovina]